MKLITFFKLNEVRERLGADLIQYTTQNQWDSVNKEEILSRLRSTKGFDVSFDDITFDEDTRVSKYYDEIVLIYIREQSDRYYSEKGSGYKFHFSMCRTLENFIRDKKYDERYVITQSKDGKFEIDLKDRDGNITKKGLEIELEPCKNCLEETEYKEYPLNKKSIFRSFNLPEFFEYFKDKKQNIVKPSIAKKHNPRRSRYSDDWDETSKKIRANNNYICEKCKVNLKDHQNLLHVHHIDGNRSNNDPRNLKVLCICCHQEQGGIGHKQLKSKEDYRLCLELKNIQMKKDSGNKK